MNKRQRKKYYKNNITCTSYRLYFTGNDIAEYCPLYGVTGYDIFTSRCKVCRNYGVAHIKNIRRILRESKLLQ